jgi:hypothetical protein
VVVDADAAVGVDDSSEVSEMQGVVVVHPMSIPRTIHTYWLVLRKGSRCYR